MVNTSNSPLKPPKIAQVLQNPNLRQLIKRLDCEIKDIKYQDQSLPFEFIYKYRQQIIQEEKMRNHIQFSFFKGGILNVSPYKDITIRQVHALVTGHYLEEKTKGVKELFLKGETERGKKEFSEQKKLLPYVTFSGTFTQRKDECLVQHSSLYCLDCDKVDDPEQLKQQILQIGDQYFETVMLFTSPSGKGVKWVIYMEPNQYPHKENFIGIQNYILETYGIPSDNTPEVSRACFVCHDEHCYVNPKFL